TEIDITKQVITLYENYQVRLITTTSTASGEEFCYITPKRAPTQRICEVATTPNGRYAYYFFYDGWQNGDLGSLYNPYYFFKGRAIHGYEDVPVEPASHGCSRIPMHISEYFHTLVHEGDAVYVDGGSDGEQIISSTPI
ncbi:MAG: L,D-transpeptidase, partial [Acidimicrobiia bacterium]